MYYNNLVNRLHRQSSPYYMLPQLKKKIDISTFTIHEEMTYDEAMKLLQDTRLALAETNNIRHIVRYNDLMRNLGGL